MNTREIANAVGRDERSVRRWVNKASDKMSGLSDKMSEAERTKKPADYNLEETLAIIESGMGKNAAEVYKQNAVTVSSVSFVTMDVMKEEMRAWAKEIVGATVHALMPMIQSAAMQSKPSPIQQLESYPQHFTILAYCKNNKLNFSMSDMIRMGKECAKISREKEMKIKKIPDERFGTVNGYHISILNEVFAI